MIKTPKTIKTKNEKKNIYIYIQTKSIYTLTKKKNFVHYEKKSQNVHRLPQKHHKILNAIIIATKKTLINLLMTTSKPSSF